MLEARDVLGATTSVDAVKPTQGADQPGTKERSPAVRKVQSKSVSWRKEKLKDSVGLLEVLASSHNRSSLISSCTEHHNAIALEEYEHGETDLVKMEIVTDDAYPH